MLIAVAETPEFTAAAKRAGMTRADIDAAIGIIASDPTGGVSLGAGLYKVRVPRAGGGKSGGFRVISLYLSPDAAVVLLSVLSKGKAANFTAKAMTNMTTKAKEIRRPKP